MIFTHQVMMFKFVTTSIKQIHWSVHFTHHFCSSVPFQSDLNYDSILSMVVKFQLCAPLFFVSQLNVTIKFSQVFMLTQKLKPYRGFFLVSVFRNFDREVLRISKQKQWF